MQRADEYIQSWCYWESRFYDNKENVRMGDVKLISRTYAQAVAGIIKRMFFDPHNSNFYLDYIPQRSSSELGRTTEIYLNEKIHYPKGYTIDTQRGDIDVIKNHNQILIKHSNNNLNIVNIVIKPV